MNDLRHINTPTVATPPSGGGSTVTVREENAR